MIDRSTYQSRRDPLRKLCDGGLLFFPGHLSMPRNYQDNTFPFRQNSHVLYYSGIERPGVALVISEDGDTLFGPPEGIDDVVWHGPHETLGQAAERAGIADLRDLSDLEACLRNHPGKVSYLPPFNGDVKVWVSELLRVTHAQLGQGADPALMQAVAAQRNVKTADEVAEMEKAHAVTLEQHLLAFRNVRAGIREADVVAAMLAPSLAANYAQSFNPITTIHGEVLHNETCTNRIEPGRLFLHDSGLESELRYCSDITRTCPVDGKFTSRQRDIYEVVLRSQLGAIEKVAPGVTNRDIHRAACRIVAQGLTDLGLMKGNPEAAVEAGAHALFLPHGIGHMIGLDVHDMEDLGDVVGYERGQARSTQFGLNCLRLARTLEPGYCVTIEPGIYFIPALIERWAAEGRHRDFIDFDQVREYLDFGGIRIEDDILVTEDGRRVLGPGIPKQPDEVEAAMAG